MNPIIFTSGLMDAGAKLFLQKSFVSLIGKATTILLHHICNSLEQGRAVWRGNRYWYAQTIENACWHTGLSQSGLSRAKQKLLDEKLITIRQEQTSDRTLWWTVNSKKLTRFYYFAEALRHAMRPDASSLDLWETWAKQNRDIIEEFRHLHSDIDSYLYFFMERGTPVKKEIEIIPAPQEKQKLNVRMVERVDGAQNAFERKKKPHVPKMRMSQWVEYWNSLDHTPKCRYGTQAYARAARFFNTHRRYRVGQCAEFVLTKDVQEKIGLAKINKIPKKSDGVRPEWEMREHIEQAALAYSPEYTPRSKKHLGSLSSFLYRDGRYGKMGTLSLFLEKVAFPPKRIEDESYDTIYGRLEEPQEYTLGKIQEVFYRSNGRPIKQDLSLAELKSAIQIAHNILAEFVKIPRRESDTLMYFFPDYVRFVNMWAERVIEMVWDNMPIQALNVGKSLWTKFIDQIQDELNRDIFTGERL